jgi:hypothetical protein
MDPTKEKPQLVKERTVTVCKESLPTSCGLHRNRFLEVETEIRDRMVSDKKTLLAEAAAVANGTDISSVSRVPHMQLMTT